MESGWRVGSGHLGLEGAGGVVQLRAQCLRLALPPRALGAGCFLHPQMQQDRFDGLHSPNSIPTSSRFVYYPLSQLVRLLFSSLSSRRAATEEARRAERWRGVGAHLGGAGGSEVVPRPHELRGEALVAAARPLHAPRGALQRRRDARPLCPLRRQARLPPPPPHSTACYPQ